MNDNDADGDVAGDAVGASELPWGCPSAVGGTMTAVSVKDFRSGEETLHLNDSTLMLIKCVCTQVPQGGWGDVQDVQPLNHSASSLSPLLSRVRRLSRAHSLTRPDSGVRQRV